MIANVNTQNTTTPRRRRRRRRGTRTERQWAETILMRSAWLDPPDRAIIRSVLQRGKGPNEIATVVNVHPRAVQNRFYRLTKRLNDVEVIAVLRHHRDWPAPLDHIAIARWVRRHTYAQIARDLGLTVHHVRRAIEHVRALLGACEQRARLTWSYDVLCMEDQP